MLGGDQGKRGSFISLISQHSKQTHMQKKKQNLLGVYACTCYVLTSARAEAAHENISYSIVRQQSPEGYLDSENILKQLEAEGDERGGSEEGDHDCVSMFMYSAYCFYAPRTSPPSERKLFIWFVKRNTQRDEMVARQSQGCEHMPSVFTGRI